MDKKTGDEKKKNTKEKKKAGFFKRFSRKPLWYRVFMIVSAIIIAVLLGAIAYILHLMSLVNYDPGTNLPEGGTTQPEFFATVENPEDYTDLPEANSVVASEHEGDGRSAAGIYNILLMGLDKDSGNLSDTMIVVTIDVNNKAIKLTSFLRDILVPIPGHSRNQLNTVYRTGGIKLIKEVFAKSFDLCIDGYVAVNYSEFTKVIDALGGVSVYMSAEEANYLNTTNYISDPQYRNLEVYTGVHWLNGAQATGYSRVRKIGHENELYDFGRTTRQREVLTALYEQLKSKSLPELLGLMETVLPLVTTDLDPLEMTNIATKAVAAGVLSSEMEQLRIPLDELHQNAYYEKMLVLDIDFEANTEVVHKFIFGDVEEKEPETSKKNTKE